MNVFIALALPIAAFAGPGFAYDRHHEYRNPLTERAGCENACVDFYRVSRPLFPLVNHVVVGARIEGACGEAFAIYGATKGEDDTATFRAYFAESPAPWRLAPLGRACGSDAVAALDEAVAVSRRWQASIDRDLYFFPRMAATPLLGRICAQAASDVAAALRRLGISPSSPARPRD